MIVLEKWVVVIVNVIVFLSRFVCRFLKRETHCR